MTIVLDTTIIVDHLRQRQAAEEALRAALTSDERVAASVLTKTELIAGCRPSEVPELDRLFALVDWVPVDDGVAERAGELAAVFSRTHPGVEVVDYVIAATTELLGATLWTRNRKHFPMFPDLSDPYEP